MKQMEDKVVLITGAAQGIGFATAKAFAEAGALVALADFDKDLVNKAADQLRAGGYKTLAIVCDVSDDAQVKAMVDKTVETFGRLDAAYNNAGIQNVLADAADQTREDFDKVIGVNLRGEWSCMKYELQQMKKQGNGAIVNCSSIGGILGGAQRGTYHAAKHGVIGLTKSAALEYASKGIRINSICPGIIHTPMLDGMLNSGQTEVIDAMLKSVPAGRLGRSEEIANAVLWLCSDASSFVIGHTLVVDGGYSIQ
ncbi:SDR family NAD(P)-dependent oxidoreductase [Pedobacter sp.]|jgi:NAD(P)-dependent dehydrogenase (short-subunit alcohol dehydrogenase family)|uniref:SDR family NAD(P)-dependent oxidoreductase n=1 Tax=Pedobacter sp. TaxID=1411316 RepID=UPI002D801E32|nr:SDR family oxidoreductase [Pedobacter sp.]